jgi:APA family basic amino acid/polyamine antiporter
MFLASKIAAAGTVALGLAGYLDALLPGMNPRGIAVGAILAFTVLNYFGVKRSSRVNLMIVIVSCGSLLLFVVAGAGSFRFENLAPFAPGGWQGTLEAAALLFFAYTGYARIATLAEEVHDPSHVIPRAIGLTIGGAVVLYLPVAVVAVGAVGAEAMAATSAPLEAAARSFPRPWVATAISVGGVTAMLGVTLSQLLGLSRMAFAMARRGDLPRFLSEIHDEYEVPGRAVLLAGAAAAVVAATGTLRGVASAAAFAILIYYGVANIAALRMPRKAKLYSDAVPLVGLVACAVLAVSLNWRVIATGTCVLAAGFVIRSLLRRRTAGAD